MLGYDTARAVFRAAKSLDAGAVIFEIARSEIGYTEQRPAEYAAVVLAAAIKESWDGPVFLQGDHFQTNPKKDARERRQGDPRDRGPHRRGDPRGLLSRSTSTPRRSWTSRSRRSPSSRASTPSSARGSRSSSASASRARCPSRSAARSARSARRTRRPRSSARTWTSTARRSGRFRGIAKVSVQTGSSHGGVVAPDGTVERVAIDFEVLRRISKVAPRGVRHRRRGAARRVDAAAGVLRQLPRPRLRRDPSRDRVPEHDRTTIRRCRCRSSARPSAGSSRTSPTSGRRARPRASSSTRRASTPSARSRRSSGTCPWARARRSADSLEREFRFLFEKLRIAGTRDTVAKYVRPADVGTAAAVGAGAGLRPRRSGGRLTAARRRNGSLPASSRPHDGGRQDEGRGRDPRPRRSVRSPCRNPARPRS